MSFIVKETTTTTTDQTPQNQQVFSQQTNIPYQDQEIKIDESVVATPVIKTTEKTTTTTETENPVTVSSSVTNELEQKMQMEKEKRDNDVV